jgi:hypothetical protein
LLAIPGSLQRAAARPTLRTDKNTGESSFQEGRALAVAPVFIEYVSIIQTNTGADICRKAMYLPLVWVGMGVFAQHNA